MSLLKNKPATSNTVHGGYDKKQKHDVDDHVKHSKQDKGEHDKQARYEQRDHDKNKFDANALDKHHKDGHGDHHKAHKHDHDMHDKMHKHDAAFDYASVAIPEIILTGVRSASSTSDNVVVTGSYLTDGVTYAALYQGSLQDLASAPASKWNWFSPDFGPSQTVTSSTFYGPNTSAFDPSLQGDIRAVGSYKYLEGASGANFNHGMIYQGPVTGVGGVWTQIDATSLVSAGDTLLNTLAHSTMGDLVVGNYDTQLSTGHAFIYNLKTQAWTELNPTGAASVTAYGIWQNSGSTYTIAGGYSNLKTNGTLDEGYLIDYNSATGAFSNFASFRFDNLPIDVQVSHINGVTGTSDGYNITGDFIRGNTKGAFFAHVEREADGSFDEAVWSEIAFPGASGTSGNTVVNDTVLGIYLNGGQTNSYVASLDKGWDLWA